MVTDHHYLKMRVSVKVVIDLLVQEVLQRFDLLRIDEYVILMGIDVCFGDAILVVAFL